MSDFNYTMSRERITAAVGNAPAVEAALKKLAGKAARGVRLPATFSAQGIDYGAQRELERLFGATGRRLPNGAFRIPLPEHLHEPSEWREAMAYFGFAENPRPDADADDVPVRLKLLYPDLAGFIDALFANDEIARHVSKPANQRDWMRLFRGVVKRLSTEECGLVTTLSQLGSDWFNDSKKLRSGALRRQLTLILATVEEYDPSDEALVLGGANIVANPYTSEVVFAAPVILTLRDGTVFDFPDCFFARRMAATLPLATVLQIESVEWNGGARLVTTSENAAPFAELVAVNAPVVYTAGYPDLAVKVFLRKLAETGVECEHAGDADLDGFRIAAEVANAIPVRRVAAADALESAPDDFGIPLTPEQTKRARAFLANPKWADFRFADAIRSMLARCRWIEQESFASVLGGKGRGKP